MPRVAPAPLTEKPEAQQQGYGLSTQGYVSLDGFKRQIEQMGAELKKRSAQIEALKLDHAGAIALLQTKIRVLTDEHEASDEQGAEETEAPAASPHVESTDEQSEGPRTATPHVEPEPEPEQQEPEEPEEEPEQAAGKEEQEAEEQMKEEVGRRAASLSGEIEQLGSVQTARMILVEERTQSVEARLNSLPGLVEKLRVDARRSEANLGLAKRQLAAMTLAAQGSKSEVARLREQSTSEVGRLKEQLELANEGLRLERDVTTDLRAQIRRPETRCAETQTTPDETTPDEEAKNALDDVETTLKAELEARGSLAHLTDLIRLAEIQDAKFEAESSRIHIEAARERERILTFNLKAATTTPKLLLEGGPTSQKMIDSARKSHFAAAERRLSVDLQQLEMRAQTDTKVISTGRLNEMLPKARGKQVAAIEARERAIVALKFALVQDGDYDPYEKPASEEELPR